MRNSGEGTADLRREGEREKESEDADISPSPPFSAVPTRLTLDHFRPFLPFPMRRELKRREEEMGEEKRKAREAGSWNMEQHGT